MHAAILVSIGCGVRQGERLRLRWSDVDFDKQTVRILLTKNNESRYVYLPESAAEALRVLKPEKVVGKALRRWRGVACRSIMDRVSMAGDPQGGPLARLSLA
jgi:integrase